MNWGLAIAALWLLSLVLSVWVVLDGWRVGSRRVREIEQELSRVDSVLAE